jgi:uncharacterized protein (DUF1330 family)
MAAYLVAHVKIHATSWLRSEYVDVTAPLEEKCGGVTFASGQHEQVGRDELGTITSVIQFPSIEAAQSFWNDPEYQRVAPIRRAGSDSHVVLIDASRDSRPVRASKR